MADVVTLLQGRIAYLEQENSYLRDLLKRWLKSFSLITKEKEETRKNEKVRKIRLHPLLER